jgi:hypothetical protein
MPKLGLQVTDRFENLRARPHQQCLHCGKILRQSETAKTLLFFDSGDRSGPFAPNQALTLIRLARNLTGKQIKWSDHVDDWKFPFRDRFPVPTLYFHSTKPNFYDKSGTPILGSKVTDRFENLRARPRQQCLHCCKILRQSETAKTQLFFDSGARSVPFAQNQALTLIRLARNLTGKQIKWR